MLTDPGSESQAELTLDVVDRSSSESERARRGAPRWRWLVGLAVVIAAGGAAWRFTRSQAAAESAVQAPSGEPRVFALGRLVPADRVRAVVANGGQGGNRIARLWVAEGDVVERGQELAELARAPQLAAALATAEAKLAQAKTRKELERTVAAARRAELEAARDAAVVRLEQARTRLERRESMEAGAASEEALGDARLELRSAAAALAEGEARVVRYAAVEGGEPLDVALAGREVEVARAEVERARAELGDARVTAPSAGTVLRLYAREGESLGTQPLLELANLERMQVLFDVYESGVRELSLGQRVRVSSSALAEPVVGTVERIAGYVRRQATVDALPAANTDARVIEVVVGFDAKASERVSAFVGLQVRGEFLP